jgi:hypothetical protein
MNAALTWIHIRTLSPLLVSNARCSTLDHLLAFRPGPRLDSLMVAKNGKGVLLLAFFLQACVFVFVDSEESGAKSSRSRAYYPFEKRDQHALSILLSIASKMRTNTLVTHCHDDIVS